MRVGLDSEAREYLRVETKLRVRYQFIGRPREDTSALDPIYEGWTQDISGGGLRLVGELPEPSWVPDLLTQDLEIAVSIDLPGSSSVYAVARVAWLEQNDKTATFGLAFTHVSKESQRRLVEVGLLGK